MSNLTYDEFVDYVHSALHYLYDPDQLRRSPLAALFGVADKAHTPSALQRILTDAIQSLEPGPNELPESRSWRIYDALFYQYVRRHNRNVVADQLGISARQLRREQRAALEVLAERLWKEFAVGSAAPDTAFQEHPPVALELASQASKDLDWLKNTPPDKPTDVKQQLPIVLDLIAALAQQQSIRLSSDLPDDLPDVAVDPVAFREILLNLLCAAMPRLSGSQIAIEARLARWEVELIVHSSNALAQISASSENDKRCLDMADELAQLCGGHLRVDIGRQPFQAILTLPALGHLPVLVIDDNADAHQLFQRYAVGTRYRITGIRQPHQAVRVAQELSPRVIILDVMMPDVDGWEVLGRLRQDPVTSRAVIVVCSILPQEALAQSLGAHAFLRKPVSRADFLKVLDRLVQDAP